MHNTNASERRWCSRLLNIIKSMTAVQIAVDYLYGYRINSHRIKNMYRT